MRIAILLLACAPLACGPIEYVGQVTRRATSEVEAARAVDAAKHAPYWWTRAVEYLHQARVEAAAADFQAANRFGRLAAEAAVQARADALAAVGAEARDADADADTRAGRALAPAPGLDRGDDDLPPLGGGR